MRDEQVRRYARHVLLPDVGGLGQTALLAATVRVDVRDPAGMIAATYLAAGGVGTVIVGDATAPQIATLSAINPDSTMVRQAKPAKAGATIDVRIPETPHWWPETEGDDTARAFWGGGLAATATMATLIAKR